jgi:hypothetical protein
VDGTGAKPVSQTTIFAEPINHPIPNQCPLPINSSGNPNPTASDSFGNNESITRTMLLHYRRQS